MNQNLLLLCSLISILSAQEANNKKRVQFQHTENDFNFGDPIKPKTKAFGVTPVSTQQRAQPGQVIFQKSPGILKQNRQALLKQGTSEGGPFIPPTPPPFPDQSAFLPQAQNLNAQLQQTGNERQIGPTPQSLAYISPQRFYLPQNAPITNRIEGPNLPSYYGVPGQVIPRIPNFEAYSPIVEDYVGQRDTDFGQVVVDPVGSDELDVVNTTPLEPPYTPPEIFTQLRQVTPLQPAVTDPLSPDVTNNRGVFFPNQPGVSGAYIQTAPEPQLIAQPIDDGAYFVEPVRDPIVFFDPNSNQTLVYDPLRDFIRPYNPETDPELQDDTEFGQMQVDADTMEPVLTSNPNGGAPGTQSANGGTIQKSGGSDGSTKSPKFWIIRKHQPTQGYEKSAINGAPAAGRENPIVKSIMKRNINSGQPAANKVIYSGKPQQKSGPISGEQLLIQLNPSKSKPLDQAPLNRQKSSFTPSTQSTQPQQKSYSPQNPQKKTTSGGYVKLVYSPIVEAPIGSRYQGFKGQASSAATSTALPALNLILIICAIPVLFSIFF